MTTNTLFLVVDDDPAGLYFKSHVLRSAGYHVGEAATAASAIRFCRDTVPAVALVDVHLPDMNGIELCRRLKAEFRSIAILQTSAAATNAHDRAVALDGGAESFMVEPIEPEELRAIAKALLRMRLAEQELRRLNESLEQTIAQRTRELLESNRKLGIEIAERQKVESALWHAQKLEAIGQLTGGIAHDFNNLLAVIVGGLEMVRQSLDDTQEISRSKLVRIVQSAQTAADRGATLTSQLLVFARRSPLNATATALSDVFAAADALFRRALGETIEYVLDLPGDLWPCQLDRVQFEAAILNLMVNARDAMPNGGRLSITAENLPDPPEDTIWPNEALTGPCVCLRVADTGTGMPPDVMARVFEPFFTTKDVGRGTGLGLSQVYGFVRQSGGHIELSSHVGVGTVVSLYLPRAEAPATSLPEPEMSTEAALTGTETIMVVEDSSEVREMAVTLLSGFGYRVLTAGDGPSALTLLRDTPVDLLFSDVVMPGGISGYDLVRMAKSMQHGLKALLTSGYTATTVPDPDSKTVVLLRKPYKRAELAERVRWVLDHS